MKTQKQVQTLLPAHSRSNPVNQIRLIFGLLRRVSHLHNFARRAGNLGLKLESHNVGGGRSVRNGATIVVSREIAELSRKQALVAKNLHTHQIENTKFTFLQLSP